MRLLCAIVENINVTRQGDLYINLLDLLDILRIPILMGVFLFQPEGCGILREVSWTRNLGSLAPYHLLNIYVQKDTSFPHQPSFYVIWRILVALPFCLKIDKKEIAACEVSKKTMLLEESVM